jgi:C-terminal processing protease CtpA/Prc
MAEIESLPPDAPRPRLCHLHKWPNFPGYGFNLHAEKTRTGQYIGKVDPGSPAEAAGLREGDRIVEVNGTNIAMENHQQVVERIKAVSDETKFLVVDESTDNYYRDRKIIVCGRMDNVQVIEAPAHVTQPTGDVSDGNGEPDAGGSC